MSPFKQIHVAGPNESGNVVSTSFETPSAIPDHDYHDAPIVVMQTTDYASDTVSNIPEIEFSTSAPAVATFLSTQFDVGGIDANATIEGDAESDKITVDVRDPDHTGSYGFDGSALVLQNWSAADLFEIKLYSSVIPESAHVFVDGTSGNDLVYLTGNFTSNVLIDGKGGTNK